MCLIVKSRIFGEGLVSLIKNEPDLEIIGVADTYEQFRGMIKNTIPDTVIICSDLSVLKIIDAVHKMRIQYPDMRIIALVKNSDKQLVTTLIEKGVSGIIAKQGAFKELVNVIRTAKSGKIYVSSILQELIEDKGVSEAEEKEKSVFFLLSNREREVLKLLSEGYSTKEIAGNMNVSVKIVKTHLSNIMNKLKIYSIAELTKHAIRHGLTSL